ncbi:MAG TPA: EAL domain-containing protein [Hyphomicrobiaceae bacterium]|nr:EAL domain-containing protein [Hyphomicrobiaceae bacterium]
MTQQFAVSDPQLATPEPLLGPLVEPLYVRMGDIVVVLSATLVSLASCVWMMARLGLDLSYAILAALVTYGVLLGVHMVARQVLNPRPQDEEAESVENDVHWQTGAAAFEAALSRQAAQLERAAAAGEDDAEAASGGTWSGKLTMPAAEDDAAAAQAFKFRPSRLPSFDDGERPAMEGTGSQPAAEDRPSPTGAMSPDINVEVIQDLIKKLADELNGPTLRDDDDAAGEHAAVADAMLGRSIAALDVAARAMRAEPDATEPASDPPDGGKDATQSGTARPLDAQIARIAEAVAAERFEVMIEPIHALSEGRPRHYEVSMRLRMADGLSLEQADYTRAAQISELRADLLPHIDAARMLRAARVARRLAERGRQGSVLSAMSGQSITDTGFLDTAAQQTAIDGGRVRLVLSFAQADARNFTPAHAEALGAMAAAGFGFALEDVTDLEMDFGKLKALGFEFVKLDAAVFLDGMQAPGGNIPAADICRYLSEFGLTLIVGAIEDDWLLAKVMGFGVLLGKGTLFGGPRLIKAMEPGAAAA